MARFFFDAHNTNAEPWDDSGTECGNREEIEAHAHQVAMRAANRRSEQMAPVMVTVVNDSQAIVMTAKLKGKDVEYEWAAPSGI